MSVAAQVINAGQKRILSMKIMTVLIAAVFILIGVSLACALYFMMRDRGATKRMVYSLMARVGLSIGLFLFILFAYRLGWIQSTGIPYAFRATSARLSAQSTPCSPSAALFFTASCCWTAALLSDGSVFVAAEVKGSSAQRLHADIAGGSLAGNDKSIAISSNC